MIQKEIPFLMKPRWLVAVICCILVFNSVAFAQPQPLPEALSDPQFLRSRTWKADKGLEAIVRNWPVYTEEQRFDGGTVLNQTEVTVLGITFTAQYRVARADSLADVIVSNKSEYGEDFCRAFVEWVTKRLGKPDKVLDGSTLAKDGSWKRVTADWLLGQSRVQLLCAGMVVPGGYRPADALLVYRHKDRLQALEDLVYIECSLTKKFIGPLFTDERTEESAPLTLIIDPNGKSLLRRNKSPFLGKTNKYTDQEILAAGEDDNTQSTFRLDRLTGNYQWNIRMKKDGRNGLDQWGTCSRIDPSRKL